MSQAINRINYFSSNGEVVRTGADAGGYDFIYETSTVRNPAYYPGDAVVLPDKREFTYAKSAAAIATNLGCNFTSAGYTAATVAAISYAIGAREITIPAQTHAALTADELRGGYVIIGMQGGTTSVHVRQIVGNDASVLDVAFKVRLDAPLSVAITAATTYIETFQNPYAAIGQSTTSTLPRAGRAATDVSAASKYFWVQTKGVTWASPQTGVGADNGGITACWREDGSLEKTETAFAVTVAASDTCQIAGFCIEGSTAGNGPLFYLT
ncbi:hypothetical protein IMZ48_26265 [Candidatus Bathyarchaeota archaeon]|nr:hypothetical protein [Candidatus Bathyarchaeota archaeon]